MQSSPAFLPFSPSTAFHGQRLNAPAPRAQRPALHSHGSVVKAVAAKPKTESARKLSRVEGLKTASKQLRYPLPEQLANDEIFISETAIQIMKFHGSYQQDDREARAPGMQKKFQFMLRLKMPAGDFPASIYQVLDDIATQYGNNTLRATTRCAWQIHGVLKANLKNVFSSIMNAGGSCVGACGDLSRNVMCTPAPFVDPLYSHARFVSRMLGELFAPQTGAFSEIWLDGEKAATLEFWKKDLDMDKVREIMRYDNGNGMVFNGHEEPIYGETYLPRKFKIGVTVPGDNSIDIYTQDIGVVCVPDNTGKVIGYNIIVGGGMGRSHRKESTFARTGDHLGYVAADKLWEALKAIVATQRDHGNRSVRLNARMKYLVDRLGIDAFRSLVESYFGESFEPFRELKPWKYEDWLGWHEQGDGNLFLGLFIENGRIKDAGDFRLRTALRRIIDAYEFDLVVTPNQNIILKNITPDQKDGIEAILKEHSVKLAEEYDDNHRISMACPALPLCGLAVAEAERFMPSVVARMNTLFQKHGITSPITMRMTGCPNGCARPYMAELGFVGSGPKTYQMWLGGSANQTRLAFTYLEKVKEHDFEKTLSPLLTMYTSKRKMEETFGDFCDRMGKSELLAYSESLNNMTSVIETSAGETPVKETSASKANLNTKLAEPSTSPYEVKLESKDRRVTVLRGVTKITVLGSNGEEQQPAAVQDDPLPSKESSKASSTVEQKKVAQKKKPRPRLTVSDEIMERLKNIAALRDMSASNVADEIISTYLAGVEDEDVAMEE
ncbi:unnamed protein product [Agarophyton chilense]|eukprot:gb/GEZJ01000123.1/.p1 GENE.gb/GEZJ01000123.1/~~gb/GEZJ01000123.1/.p1  ORF type:complete len:823 (-),score=129.14 gb/GEZJ01000123.1/:660-3005(-)